MSEFYGGELTEAKILQRPVQKAVEVEVTVRFDDGARAIVRYVPEPNEGLRVELVTAHEDIPILSPAVRMVEHADIRHIVVKDSAQVEFEHLRRSY